MTSNNGRDVSRTFTQCIKYRCSEMMHMRVPQIHISNTNPMEYVNENPTAYIGLETRLEIVLVDPDNNPDDRVDWDNFVYEYDMALTNTIPVEQSQDGSPVDSDFEEADHSSTDYRSWRHYTSCLNSIRNNSFARKCRSSLGKRVSL